VDFVRVSFRSLSPEIKVSVVNQDKAGLEQELKKIKYSQATRQAARYHFSRAGENPEVYSVSLVAKN
jgi:hypothetical protein